MVSGFATSPPNAELIQLAADELRRASGVRMVDIGCGAARNAVPIVRLGWHVLGLDLSRPMLDAAASRAREEELTTRLHVAMAPMTSLPVRDGSCDFVIAHGIWNLARSTVEFRRAVAEAARVARTGAALFVFTFSRQTLPPETVTVPGEEFVFTEFSGAPQCFLTQAQLVEELSASGFAPDPGVPLKELNRPRSGMLQSVQAPVIYEGLFRRRG